VPIEVSSDFLYETVDFQTGGSSSIPSWEYPKISRRFQWILKTESDIMSFRGLLGPLKGRFKAAYLPTWFDDFELYETEVASSSTVRVKNNEFHKMIDVNPALNTLMILTRGNSP